MGNLIKKATVQATINRYIDKQGKEQKFNKNIGSLMENDNGQQFLLIDKSFNLLAVAHDQDKGSVCLQLVPEANYKQAQQPKPTSTAKASHNVYEPEVREKALHNARELLANEDMRIKANGGKDPLPFDDPIPF